MTLHNAGSSAGFNIALKREGEKRMKKREKEIITTEGIRIWSPIQVLTRRTERNFVERARHGTVKHLSRREMLHNSVILVA